jgi:hypothetical protein
MDLPKKVDKSKEIKFGVILFCAALCQYFSHRPSVNLQQTFTKCRVDGQWSFDGCPRMC